MRFLLKLLITLGVIVGLLAALYRAGAELDPLAPPLAISSRGLPMQTDSPMQWCRSQTLATTTSTRPSSTFVSTASSPSNT